MTVSDGPALEYGQSYDPYSNSRSVEDPVDGELTRVENDPGKPEKGWYYLEGPKKIDKAGYYDFTSMHVISMEILLQDHSR